MRLISRTTRGILVTGLTKYLLAGTRRPSPSHIRSKEPDSTWSEWLLLTRWDLPRRRLKSGSKVSVYTVFYAVFANTLCIAPLSLSPSSAVVLNHISSHFLILLSDSSHLYSDSSFLSLQSLLYIHTHTYVYNVHTLLFLSFVSPRSIRPTAMQWWANFSVWRYGRTMYCFLKFYLPYTMSHLRSRSQR